MAWTLCQKLSAVAAICVFCVVAHIAVMSSSSSQTAAIIFRIELITIIESVMFLMSRYVVWRTLAPLLTCAGAIANSSPLYQTGSSSSQNTPVSNFGHRSLRKSKNSESDLVGLNIEHLPAVKTTTCYATAGGKIVLLIYLTICHLCYLTNLFLINTEPHWFSMLAYSCFGSYIQLLTALTILKLLSLAVGVFKRLRGTSTSTSAFSPKKTALFAFVYMIGASSLGLYTTSKLPSVKHVSIPLKDLPSNLEGLQVIQLTDIHLGPTVGFSKLSSVVSIVNQLNPDLVVVTGDLVDGTVEQLKMAAQPLQNLRSKHGTFFVSGNHEYYTGNVDDWFQYLRSLGLSVLHNSHVKVPATVSAGEGQICLAGTDDIQADKTRYSGHRFDLAQAVQSCPFDLPVILLAHQPRAAKMALDSNFRIDLVLSGHTHAGQMFPLMIGAYLLNPFYVGLYQYGKSGAHVYVSQGTQYWGIPMRIGTSMEITSIVLRRSPSDST